MSKVGQVITFSYEAEDTRRKTVPTRKASFSLPTLPILSKDIGALCLST